MDAKTVRIPTFDGKSKNFVIWWTRFKAYAKEKQFSQALGERKEADLPNTQEDADALDQADAANKAALAAVSRNEKALSNLAVAFTTAKALVHYHKANDDDWPDGLASNVVKSLMKKYRPKDLIAGIEYETALREFKLKKNDDPTTIFDHFTEVNVRFGINDPDKMKMIAIALEKLPREYVHSFTSLTCQHGKLYW